MSTQFELEQHLMQCWNVVDDIGLVSRALMDHGATQDQIANMLIGLKDLYQVRFDETFTLFETLLKEQHEEVVRLKTLLNIKHGSVNATAGKHDDWADTVDDDSTTGGGRDVF
jgi:hypothetical protein